MKEFFESTYGDRIAPVYDEWFGEYDPAIVDVLGEFAKGEERSNLASAPEGSPCHCTTAGSKFKASMLLKR